MTHSEAQAGGPTTPDRPRSGEGGTEAVPPGPDWTTSRIVKVGEDDSALYGRHLWTITDDGWMGWYHLDNPPPEQERYVWYWERMSNG